MPTARCDECAAQVAFYLHAGRKLTEIACHCGGALTCAPWTWCRECDRNGHHRKDPKNPKRKLCDRCLDGEGIGYPYYRSATKGPTMSTVVKVTSVKMTGWERKRVRGEMIYYHASEQWSVQKVRIKGSKRPLFQAAYLGPERSRPGFIPRRATLREAQLDALNAIRAAEESTSSLDRAIRAQRDGNSTLMLDCIFDYIDEKFLELESTIDDRFDRLRISDS